MKTLLTFIICLAACTAYAQDGVTAGNEDVHSYIATDNIFLEDKNIRGYNLRSSFFLPLLDETIEQYLASEVFGVKALMAEAKDKFYDSMTRRKERDLRQINVVSLEVEEVFRIVPSTAVSFRYRTLNRSNLNELSDVKFVTYDFKNKKVVQLSDIMNANVVQQLAANGLPVENATNICLDNDSIFIMVGKTMLNIDISKFYKNMTDYGIALTGRTRTAYEQQTETPTYMEGMEAPTLNGTANGIAEYMRANIKYPDIPKQNQEVNLLQQQQQMQRMQQLRERQSMPMDNNTVLAAIGVDKDGAVFSTQILTGANPYFKAEALRVLLELPTLEPATMNGANVRARLIVPITFRQQMRGGFGGFGGGFGGF